MALTSTRTFACEPRRGYMAQAGWRIALAETLCESGQSMADEHSATRPRNAVHRQFAIAWRRTFAPRIRLAAIIAHASMRPASASLSQRWLRIWPGALTHIARWGGKTTPLSTVEEKFGIELPKELNDEFATLGDIVRSSTTGVFPGTGVDGSQSLDTDYQTLYERGTDRIWPFTVIAGMYNAAAAWCLVKGLQ